MESETSLGISLSISLSKVKTSEMKIKETAEGMEKSKQRINKKRDMLAGD